MDALILSSDYISQRVVNAERHQRAESTSHSLAHVQFSAGGKLAWPISAEVNLVS